jgi:hypothetical protein
MQAGIIRLLFILSFLSVSISGFSQDESHKLTKSVILLDSLKRNEIIFNGEQKKPEISLSPEQSVRYLQQKMQPELWKNTKDPLRQAIGQLVFSASHPPFDSAEYFLNRYPFDSIKVPWDKFYTWEEIKLKIPAIQNPPESVSNFDSIRASAILKDTTIMVLIDTLHKVIPANGNFPFTFYEYPYQGDSIAIAVKSLLDLTAMRDSSLLNIYGSGNAITPVWLNSRSGRMQRFWLKNGLYDSVTVWIGSNSRNTIGLYLEDGVTFKRPAKQDDYSQAKIELKEIDRSKLLTVKEITIKPQYWKYRSEASFALNQAAVSNWVKGGESSISTTFDITGYADYENKSLKINSSNFARIKFGLIASGNGDDKWDVRKNIDLLETNSKLNHKAFGKFDFSAILLFKTQIASGFTYPTDTTRVLVSKFLNPAVITVGLGLDYKPNKNTSINFSPLSYKGTFVTDTTGTKGINAIDQTKYGIAGNRRSLNEPGVSFMITNEYKPVKTVTITNRLQLFTNYIHNPQNIDIDWEMIATASLNWFTDVRLNTHLIYDDDTKTLVKDKSKKTARTQFKELLGFSFIFRF